jgi:hypothetical protein
VRTWASLAFLAQFDFRLQLWSVFLIINSIIYNRVLAVTSGEVIKPFPDRASEGTLQFQVAFAEMSDPSIDNSARYAISNEIKSRRV